MTQVLEVPKDFVKIQCPARIQCSGPTMIGKSEFILKIVKFRNEIFSTNMTRIMYFLPPHSMHTRRQYLTEMKTFFPQLEVYEGLPKLMELALHHEREPCLVILEDLADEILNSGEMLSLFFKESHHMNITVLYR